jgi:hypothetical protein
LRIAALAFGVLAGLVASFILALGGLDASELAHLDGRQMQLVTFGLFVIANLGILGAGLVLATPLVGAILFVVGAIGWVVAALAMHHGPDYVMLTPPGILLIAAALSIVALLRRRNADEDETYSQRQSVAAQRAAMRDADTDDDTEDENEADDDSPGVAVGASFFGDAGTATPLRGTMADIRRENSEPVRRRVEPPRQKPVFRDIEDEYDDEESGFSRVARGVSSVLSFGLYAALAAAAVLIFWNLRPADIPKNTATKIEASAAQPKTTAPVLAPPSSSAPTMVAETPAAPTLSPTPTASAAPELVAPTPPQTNGSSRLAVPAAGSLSSTMAEAPPSTQPATSAQPSEPGPLPAGVVVAEAPIQTPTETAPASSSEPQPGDDLSGEGATGPLMPYPMPAVIAAGRPTAARPRPAAPATPAPRADTGL